MALSDCSFVARGAMAACAPARLVAALALVLVLAGSARLADWVYLAAGGRPISPSGFAVGQITESQQSAAERTYARIARTFVSGTSAAAGIDETVSRSQLAQATELAFLERLAAARANGADTARLGQQYRDIRAAFESSRARGPAEAFAAEWTGALRRLIDGTLILSPVLAADAAIDLAVRIPLRLVGLVPWFAILWGVPALALASLLGGGVARMAALEAALAEALPLAAAVGWTLRRARTLVLVPVLPAAMAGILLGLAVVLGLALRWPVLDLLGGLLYGVILLLVTVVVVGGGAALIGWPLSVAAVACGDADAADATVRSSSYLFRSPVRTLGLAAVGAVALAAGTVVVGGTAALILALAAWSANVLGGEVAANAAGAGGLVATALPELPLGGVTTRSAAFFINAWEWLVVALVGAYVAGAIADLSTRVYLRLRLACDGQDPSNLDGAPLGRPISPAVRGSEREPA